MELTTFQIADLAYSAFEFDDNAADAACEEIIRLGTVYLTEEQRNVCPTAWQTRRGYAACIYQRLKPLCK